MIRHCCMSLLPRMTRSLANGRFLVPQLLDKVVREYGPDGKVTWEYRTPETPPECWPFTAIRTSNGRMLVTLTHGNRVVERLLRLHTKAGLELGHFADVVRPALARPHGWLGGWLDNLP